jgi:hypothetical protein
MITIHKPIMRADTGRRLVGLAAHKLLQEPAIVEVFIDYKRKDGSYLYPNPFKIRKIEALSYGSSVIKGVKIHYVPIDKMTEGHAR